MFDAVIKNENEYNISKCDIKSETDLHKGKNQTNSLSSDDINLKIEDLSSSNENEETVWEFKKEEVILKSESEGDESETENLPSTGVNKEPDDSDEVLKKELSFSGDDEIVLEIKTEELILKTELDDGGPDDSGPESNSKEAEKYHTITNIQEMLMKNEILGKQFRSRLEEQKAAPHILTKDDGSILKKYSCNYCDYKTNHKTQWCYNQGTGKCEISVKYGHLSRSKLIFTTTEIPK